MKKIIAAILLMLGISLTSCGPAGPDLNKMRSPEVSNEIKEELNILDFDDSANSDKLYKDKRDAKSYFDIYVPTDAKDRLFMTSTEIKGAVDERTKEILANTLMFNVNEGIFPDELNAAFNEIYNDTYGIKTLDLGFPIDTVKPDLTKGVGKNVYDMHIYKALADFESVRLEIVYLPVYVVRMHNDSAVLKDYFFIPVHSAFVADSKEIHMAENEKGYELKDLEASGIEVVSPRFDKSNTKYLAAKPEDAKSE